MGKYRKEWPCCDSVTETDAWEPDQCPFCRAATKAAAPADARIEALARKLVEFYPTKLPEMYCDGEPVGRKLVEACRAPAEDAREEVQDEPPLYDQALDLVNEAQRASVSLVQRRLRIGWSEARDLIQLMHDRSQIPDAWLPPGVYPRRAKLQGEKEE